MSARHLPRNDTNRCQNCDGHAKLQRVKTKTVGETHTPNSDGWVSGSADWKRVKWRVLECQDCGHTWRSDR